MSYSKNIFIRRLVAGFVLAAGAGGLVGNANAQTTGERQRCTASMVSSMDSIDDFCSCGIVTTGTIRAIQRRPDFPDILAGTNARCPALAAVLSDLPTQATPMRENESENDEHGKGPVGLLDGATIDARSGTGTGSSDDGGDDGSDDGGDDGGDGDDGDGHDNGNGNGGGNGEDGGHGGGNGQGGNGQGGNHGGGNGQGGGKGQGGGNGCGQGGQGGHGGQGGQGGQGGHEGGEGGDGGESGEGGDGGEGGEGGQGGQGGHEGGEGGEGDQGAGGETGGEDLALNCQDGDILIDGTLLPGDASNG